MKAKIEIDLKDIPLEKIQRTLLEILQTLKAIGMVENGKIEIFTPTGVVTEKCILQESKVVA